MPEASNAPLDPALQNLSALKAPSHWRKSAAVATLTATVLGASYFYRSTSEDAPLPVPVERDLNANLSSRLQFELKLFNDCLTNLRTEQIWCEHPRFGRDRYFEKELPATITYIESVLKEAGRDPNFVLSKQQQLLLTQQLTDLKSIQTSICNNSALTKEQVVEFNHLRAKFKLLELQVTENLTSRNEAVSVGDREVLASRSNRAPIIVPVAEPLPSGSRELQTDISTLLKSLWWLSSEERQRLTVGIIEDETTKVVRLVEAEEPGFDEPVLDVFVQKNIMVQGEPHQVVLHFRQTIEKLNSVATGIGSSTDGGVIVRNRLVDEVPVTDDFSISAYVTCLTYFASANSSNAEITFTNDSELTFYSKNSSAFRDVVYRSAARTLSHANLVASNKATLDRAAKLLNGVVQNGAESLIAIAVPNNNDLRASVVEAKISN